MGPLPACLLSDSARHPLLVPCSPKMELGQQCKRLIDAGRAKFLEDEGMAVEMVRYCSPEDSLENCLLLAWERS